jgi:hypothetical protein
VAYAFLRPLYEVRKKVQDVIDWCLIVVEEIPQMFKKRPRLWRIVIFDPLWWSPQVQYATAVRVMSNLRLARKKLKAFRNNKSTPISVVFFVRYELRPKNVVSVWTPKLCPATSVEGTRARTG